MTGSLYISGYSNSLMSENFSISEKLVVKVNPEIQKHLDFRNKCERRTCPSDTWALISLEVGGDKCTEFVENSARLISSEPKAKV